MTDFGSPVAQNIRPPDPQQGIQAISGMMGLRQKQQDYETGAAQQQSAQAEAQKKQAEIQEYQRRIEMHKSGVDPKGRSILGNDGEIDVKSLMRAEMEFNPLTAPAALQSVAEVLDKRIKLKDSIVGLNRKHKEDIAAISRASINNSDGVTAFNNGIDAYVKQNPDAQESVSHAKDLIGSLKGPVSMETKNKGFLHLAREFQPEAATRAEQALSIKEYTTPSGDRGTAQDNPYAPIGMGQTGPATKIGLAPQVVGLPGGNPAIIKGGGQIGGGGNGGGPAPTTQDMEAFGHYQGGLNDRVRAASDLLPRLKQATAALDQLSTGAGSTTRAGWGRKLQAMGFPESLVNKVSGGDIAELQKAQKYLFQATFAGLRQSMQGDPARVAEFNAADKIFPNIDTDPKAAKDILRFMEDQANRDHAELQALNRSRKDRTFNAVTWQGDYQTSLRENKVPGVPASQNPAGQTDKSITMEDIKKYATDNKISIEASKAHAHDRGYVLK